MKHSDAKIGMKVKLGGCIGTILHVGELHECQMADFNLKPIGKSFYDFEIRVQYVNHKGKTIKGGWSGRETRKLKSNK